MQFVVTPGAPGVPFADGGPRTRDDRAGTVDDLERLDPHYGTRSSARPYC